MPKHGYIALRPRKPDGSLGRTAQDGHFDSHTAPELCMYSDSGPELKGGTGTRDTHWAKGRERVPSGGLS